MTIGGEMLLKEFGSVIGVAKAYIRGEIKYFEDHVGSVCDKLDIVAAEAAIRLEAEGIIKEANNES